MVSNEGIRSCGGWSGIVTYSFYFVTVCKLLIMLKIGDYSQAHALGLWFFAYIVLIGFAYSFGKTWKDQRYPDVFLLDLLMHPAMLIGYAILYITAPFVMSAFALLLYFVTVIALIITFSVLVER